MLCNKDRPLRAKFITRSLLLFLFVVFGSVQAQAVWPPATLSPSTPSQNDVIQATFTVPSLCGTSQSTSVNGNVVRTDVQVFGCLVGPPPPPPVERSDTFGPLPAGTYTYQIYFLFEDSPPELRSTQTLVVSAAPPPAPALGHIALALLAMTLVGVSLVCMARQSV